MGRKPILSNEEVLTTINKWTVDHGMPPTIDELRNLLGVGSTRTILRYLRSLEKEGSIKRWAGSRGIRSLRQSDDSRETVSVPVVGEIAAGQFMTAEQHIEAWARLPKEKMLLSGKFFLLRVRGDSMNRTSLAGNPIDAGDLVLVRQQSTADSGEIVVALFDGEATIKRFVMATGYAVLKPESSNPAHHPILVGPGFSIQGVAVRVFKRGSDHFSFVKDEDYAHGI